MKKTNIFYLLVAILLTLICSHYFIVVISEKTAYDISPQGTSEGNSQFVPNKSADFISTTTETENDGIIILIITITVMTIVSFIIKRAAKKKTRKSA